MRRTYTLAALALGLSVLTQVSCAPSTKPDAVTSPCADEACVRKALYSSPKSLEQQYFVIQEAVENGLKLDDPNSVMRQRFASLATFVGSYAQAAAVYPHWLPDKSPLDGAFLLTVPAREVILKLAHDRKAVFVNEAHANVRTRAFVYSLLQPLRAEGFNYLAVEALAVDAALGEESCSGVVASDSELSVRGYPIQSTGYYIREPIFGQIVRTALRLGFVLVAYEPSGAIAETRVGREQGMAHNLACTFEQDPAARLVVLAGFDHIAESANYDETLKGGRAAARFKASTGIDPLSVETTSLFWMPPATHDRIHWPKKRGASDAFVLKDDAGRYFGSNAFDLFVAFPDSTGRDDAGSSWLTLGGARQRIHVQRGACNNERNCLASAYLISEFDGIAFDRCVFGEHDDTCALFLPPGTFDIKYSDDQQNALGSRRIFVESDQPLLHELHVSRAPKSGAAEL